MRRNAIVLLVAILLVGGSLATAGVAAGHSSGERALECEYPLTVEDATGESVTIEEPPERVVTTTPSAAQMMWEFDAAEKVVGVTQYASYLEGADDRIQVSKEDGTLSVEKVVNASPDLVLAPNTTAPDTLDQLRQAGLTVYHFSAATSLEDVFAQTQLAGELTDECEAAEETIAWMDEELSTVEQAVDGEPRPTVLYTFFDFTAGNGTHIHDIIQTAGGENVASQAGIEGYQPISDEVVVDADPDWIVLNSEDPALPESEVFNETTAVREDQVVVVEVERINQPAPWNVRAVVTIAQALHPEAYAAAADAGDGAETDEGTGSNDSTTDGEDVADEPGRLPGFGPVVALAALLGSVVALRRR